MGEPKGTTASIWFEIWGWCIRVKKSIFSRQISDKFRFSRQIFRKFRFFQANFQKISIFQGNLETIFLPGKNCSFTTTSGQSFLLLFKSHHFRTYFLYMIRYSLIIFHDPSTTPTTTLRPSLRPSPCPKSGGRDPQPSGLTPLDSNGKEAFSRRKELLKED